MILFFQFNNQYIFHIEEKYIRISISKFRLMSHNLMNEIRTFGTFCFGLFDYNDNNFLLRSWLYNSVYVAGFFLL